MGRWISKNEYKPSEEEMKNVKIFTPLYINFYNHATKENFEEIRKYDDAWYYLQGDKHKLYSLAIRQLHPEFDMPLTPKEKEYLTECLSHLLTSDIEQLSSRDLDRLWSLWYATGNTDYKDRIHEAHDTH